MTLRANLVLLEQKKAMKMADVIQKLILEYFAAESDELEAESFTKLIESWKAFCLIALEDPKEEDYDPSKIGTDKMGEVLKSFFTRISTMNISKP